MWSPKNPDEPMDTPDDPAFAEAHASLAEMYVLRDDYPAAWRHARVAEANGVPRVVEMLVRNGVK